MRSTVCVLFAVAVLSPRAASASLVTIEPDDFAPGANLTAATPGVLLFAASATGLVENPLSLSPVFAQHSAACDMPGQGSCYAATGTQGFSPFSTGEGSLFGLWSSDRFPGDCFEAVHGTGVRPVELACSSSLSGFRALLMEFTTPTTYVDIAGVWHSDFLELRAYDESFHRVSLTETLTSENHAGLNVGTLSAESAIANIKFVIAGSTEGGIALDVVHFEQVPEPSTLLLSTIGCIALARRLSSNRSRN